MKEYEYKVNYINIINGDCNKKENNMRMIFNKELLSKLISGEIDPSLFRFKVIVEAWDLDEKGNPQKEIDENGNIIPNSIKKKKIDNYVCNLQLFFAPITEEELEYKRKYEKECKTESIKS